MTTDCSLFMKIVSSEYLQNMLCIQIWHSEQFWYKTFSADVVSFWKRFTCTDPVFSNGFELKDIKISMNIAHINKKNKISKIQFDTFFQWFFRLLAKKLSFTVTKKRKCSFINNFSPLSVQIWNIHTVLTRFIYAFSISLSSTSSIS